MLFNQFSPKGKGFTYTNSVENVMKIIDMLDPHKCRLSFCEYNASEELGCAEAYPEDMLNYLLREIQTKGFEVKFFSSFGQEKKAACGMLGGKEPEYIASEKWNELSDLADKLILKYTD